MRASAKAASNGNDSADGAFWERLWRSAGLQSAALFVAAAMIYGSQPPIGSSAEAVAAFYDGDRARIFVAAALSGLAALNLMWFAAAIRTELSNAGREGWGAAVTGSSAAFGALFFVFAATVSSLAFSIADAASDKLTTGANDFAWSCVVLSSFPRAMVIMSGSFGFWRAGVFPNAVFGVCVLAVVLVLAGGTTWASVGLWAPDGLYARYVSPGICIAWLGFVSAFLLWRAPGRSGW